MSQLNRNKHIAQACKPVAFLALVFSQTPVVQWFLFADVAHNGSSLLLFFFLLKYILTSTMHSEIAYLDILPNFLKLQYIFPG